MLIEEERIIPYSCGLYRISKDGVIKDIKGEVQHPALVDGELLLTLHGNGWKYTTCVATLVLVTFANIKVPANLWWRISPRYMDGNPKNVNLNNLFYSFGEIPLELENKPGFYYIPYYTDYAINERGDLYHIPLRQKKKWHCNVPAKNAKIKGGYLINSRTYKDIGDVHSLFRHRALCLVFKYYETNPNLLIVNHINGIPGSDDLSNLEWSTYLLNSRHAYDNDLFPNKLRPVLYKNWITGETKNFKGISECARLMELSESFIGSRLRRSSTKRYDDGHLFKYDDGEPWKATTFRIHGKGDGFNVVSRNVHTGEVQNYSSVVKASEHTQVETAVILRHIHENVVVATKGFNFRKTTENVVWPNHSDRHLQIYKKYPIKSPHGVVVTDLIDNIEMFFTSCEEAATFFNKSKCQIGKRINYGILLKNRFKFSLYKLTENFGPPIEESMGNIDI